MEIPKEIKTERLLLRKYIREDADAIFSLYAQDEEVTKYLTWRPHRNIDATRAFVTEKINAWSQGNDYTWAIILGDNTLIGSIGLRTRDFRANFGIVIGRPFWGNSYGTEANRTIVQLAFQQSRIHRVWAVCDTENIASARAMEKAGLSCEGVLRKWIIHPQFGETPRDCLCYSIIREK